MAGTNVVEFTDANFESEVIKSSQPVLIDFWAQWCGPCIALAPTIDKVADRFAGKVKVGKMDIDKHSQVAGTLGIMAIPTLLIYKDGKQVGRLQGSQHESAIAAALDKILA